MLLGRRSPVLLLLAGFGCCKVEFHHHLHPSNIIIPGCLSSSASGKKETHTQLCCPCFGCGGCSWTFSTFFVNSRFLRPENWALRQSLNSPCHFPWPFSLSGSLSPYCHWLRLESLLYQTHYRIAKHRHHQNGFAWSQESENWTTWSSLWISSPSPGWPRLCGWAIGVSWANPCQ